MGREGRFGESPNDEDARQDQLVWLREDDNQSAESKPLGEDILHCMRMLRGITHQLAELKYKGSSMFRVPKQLQLAFYPGDSKSVYVRHLDACLTPIYEMGLLGWLRDCDYRERVVTAILYLNKVDRTAASGGELRLFLPQRDSEGSSSENKLDIIPRGGTLVLFDARLMEHTVLPSTEDRFALTLWVAGQPSVTSSR